MPVKAGTLSLIAFAIMVSIVAAQPTTYCNSQANMSTGQMTTFVMHGVTYHVTQNYITPTYSGVTINGTSYQPLYPSQPVMINPISAYVEVTRINYIPINPSEDFIICNAVQGPNTVYSFNISNYNYGYMFFTYFGTTISLSTSANTPTPVTVDIVNVTHSSPPSEAIGYVKALALNLSIKTNAPLTSINVTQAVSCFVPQKDIMVSKLINGVWIQQPIIGHNSSSCSIMFQVPPDPIVGIFYRSNNVTTTIPTTTSTMSTSTRITSSITTTVPPPTSSLEPQTTMPPALQVPQNYEFYAAGAIIAIIVLYLIYRSLSRRHEKHANKA